MSQNVVSTPTQERCVTSYAARTQYKPAWSIPATSRSRTPSTSTPTLMPVSRMRWTW